jgi:flagellar biosynthesis/type III secretory pathway M-ring protein FliF/YscJ
MTCRKRIGLTLTIILLTAFTLSGQTRNYLSQKLELEQALQNKISQAVERILGNDHFIVDVKADLDFVPDHRVEEVYEPAEEGRRRVPGTPGERSESAREKYDDEFTEILPGIPAKIGDRGLDVLTEEIPEESAAVREEQAAILPGVDVPETERLRSRSVARSTPLIPKVNKLDISIILKEGIAPDLVESIRQVAIVASHFDRSRGDMLSIMTTTFSDDQLAKAERDLVESDVRYEPSREELEKTDETQRLIQQIQNQIERLSRQQEMQATRSAEPTPTENMLLKIIDKLNTRQSLTDDLEAQKMITEQKLRLEMLAKDTTRLQELRNEIAALKLQLATQQMETGERQRTQAVSEGMYREKQQLEEAISEKLALLSDTQEELLNMEKAKIPYWFWGLLAALVAAIIVLVVMILNKGKKRPPDQKTEEANQKSDEEALRQKILNELKESKKESKLERDPVSPPDHLEKKAELEGIRKNIVNMSVANPDAASRIIRDWMEEEETPADETVEKGESQNE